MNESAVALFTQQRIRFVWYEDRLYYSVIDSIHAFTLSRDPSRQWRRLKQKLACETSGDILEKCISLPLLGADGKMRNTDCADTETMLRIVQSIPSPKAEPFKQWLAQVGTERIAEVDDPETAFEEWRRRAIASYVARGYSQEWAEKRVEVMSRSSSRATN